MPSEDLLKNVTFFVAYLLQISSIVYAISFYLNRKYVQRDLKISCDFEWLMKKLLIQAHRLDDVLSEIGVDVPIFMRHYCAIKRDFAHFYVYEILYRIGLIKRNTCPVHGPMYCISDPGSVLDSLMRKAVSDADEVYALLNVKRSEFTLEDKEDY